MWCLAGPFCSRSARVPQSTRVIRDGGESRLRIHNPPNRKSDAGGYQQLVFISSSPAAPKPMYTPVCHVAREACHPQSTFSSWTVQIKRLGHTCPSPGNPCVNPSGNGRAGGEGRFHQRSLTPPWPVVTPRGLLFLGTQDTAIHT